MKTKAKAGAFFNQTAISPEQQSVSGTISKNMKHRPQKMQAFEMSKEFASWVVEQKLQGKTNDQLGIQLHEELRAYRIAEKKAIPVTTTRVEAGQCQGCKKETLLHHRSTQKRGWFCHYECEQEMLKLEARKAKKVCLYCEKQFPATPEGVKYATGYVSRKYCSKQCSIAKANAAREARRKIEIGENAEFKFCENPNCSEKFYRTFGDNFAVRRYCSKKCLKKASYIKNKEAR